MKLPSIFHSTISIMAFMSLLTVIYCIINKIAIQWELLSVLTGITGAYIWARIPSINNITTDETIKS